MQVPTFRTWCADCCFSSNSHLKWMAGLLQVRAAYKSFGLWGDAVVFLKVRLCEACVVHFCSLTALALDCC